jgi:hypothetical protein
MKMKEHEEKSGDASQIQRKDVKKPYTSPRFSAYGSVAKLTQTGTGSGTDGGGQAGMMMVCL